MVNTVEAVSIAFVKTLSLVNLDTCTHDDAHFNPLNPKLFSFETTLSMHMPLIHLISISVQYAYLR